MTATNRLFALYVCMIGYGLLISTGCNSRPAGSEANSSTTSASQAGASPTASKANDLPDLTNSMDKLADSIKKPEDSFHLSFKKTSSTGQPLQFEADISPSGVTGQQSYGTQAESWNGAPVGSQPWRFAVMEILTNLPDRDIGLGQPGMKYAADESTGAFDTRRYDFDLASVPVSEKSSTLLGSNIASSSSGGRRLKDYNVKGSAWIEKSSQRLVRFQFDYEMVYSDGDHLTTHYEAAATKKP